jgi:RNA polymerase sigma-70 factor, ECF subfamily
MTRDNLAEAKRDEPKGAGVRSGEQSIPSAEDALARGDHREALALCARAHGPGIGRLCMALTGSQAEADELVHEVLLLAYDAFPSYRAEGTLRSWLFGIARRVCARHLEKRVRQAARLSLVHDGSRAPSAEETVIANEGAARAREALATLKPSEREVLLLRYESDLPFRDVALACGIDEPTARKRVGRAIERLRESLRDPREHARGDSRSSEEKNDVGQ